MKKKFLKAFMLFFISLSLPLWSTLHVGVAHEEITPPIGIPSAGYADRQGKGMEGTHDPLMALCLFIDNESKKIALCSVDHLGFSYEMVQQIRERVHAHPGLENCMIFVGSSHTHSGAGGFLNLPGVGPMISGPYHPEIVEDQIEKTAKVIIAASEHTQLAKIGIGYGLARNLTKYRGIYPEKLEPLQEIAVIKVTDLHDKPLAVWFNYPIHPTILRANNMQFSADFVGYTRQALQKALGDTLEALFFNGAQGDIEPKIFDEKDRFAASEILGNHLAESVETIWQETTTSEDLSLDVETLPYILIPKPNGYGFGLPVKQYPTELNLLVMNGTEAFVTIPGELSAAYDYEVKAEGKNLGYSHISILGLTNDAHGYIILPEAWRRKAFESILSFGGEFYGDETKERIFLLLQKCSPKNP